MVYLVVFLCVFNIVTWLLFLRNFKKLFTTDGIIEAAKSECNKIVTDLNRNADRNITLIDGKINNLQGLIKEADRKIRLLMDLEKQGAELSEFQSKLSGAQSAARAGGALKKALDAYGKAKVPGAPGFSGLGNAAAVSEKTVSITESGRNELNAVAQKTLFDDEQQENPVRADTAVTVTPDGASYAEIPVVTPDVFVRAKPVPLSKIDLKSEMLALFDSGMSVEQIAQKLFCSTTEVQFALSVERDV